MGKTVPSYRMALEFEINNWKGFRKTLQSDEEKQAFDWLMDMCRSNGMASQNACNPVIFEPMVMSILLSQQKEFRELEYKLNDVIWQEICAQETHCAKQPENSPTQTINPFNKSEKPRGLKNIG